MGKDATVWMRATRWHTYQGRPIAEDEYYLVHPEMVETIAVVLKWAVPATPPPRATHTPTTLRVP